MASSRDLPDIDRLAQLCEKVGSGLLITAGALRERKQRTSVDDWILIEVEWEMIEMSAHELLKALAR